MKRLILATILLANTSYAAPVEDDNKSSTAKLIAGTVVGNVISHGIIRVIEHAFKPSPTRPSDASYRDRGQPVPAPTPAPGGGISPMDH